MAAGASITIPFTTTVAGPFTLAHNLGYIPSTVIFEFTNANAGTVWFQTPRYDSSNLYLEASDVGVSGYVIVYGSCSGC
jgi:hypothetical protein